MAMSARIELLAISLLVLSCSDPRVRAERVKHIASTLIEAAHHGDERAGERVACPPWIPAEAFRIALGDNAIVSCDLIDVTTRAQSFFVSTSYLVDCRCRGGTKVTLAFAEAPAGRCRGNNEGYVLQLVQVGGVPARRLYYAPSDDISKITTKR